MADLKRTHTIVEIFTHIITQFITQVIVNQHKLTQKSTNLRRILCTDSENVEVNMGCCYKLWENETMHSLGTFMPSVEIEVRLLSIKYVNLRCTIYRLEHL